MAVFESGVAGDIADDDDGFGNVDLRFVVRHFDLENCIFLIRRVNINLEGEAVRLRYAVACFDYRLAIGVSFLSDQFGVFCERDDLFFFQSRCTLSSFVLCGFDERTIAGLLELTDTSFFAGRRGEIKLYDRDLSTAIHRGECVDIGPLDEILVFNLFGGGTGVICC